MGTRPSKTNSAPGASRLEIRCLCGIHSLPRWRPCGSGETRSRPGRKRCGAQHAAAALARTRHKRSGGHCGPRGWTRIRSASRVPRGSSTSACLVVFAHEAGQLFDRLGDWVRFGGHAPIIATSECGVTLLVETNRAGLPRRARDRPRTGWQVTGEPDQFFVEDVLSTPPMSSFADALVATAGRVPRAATRWGVLGHPALPALDCPTKSDVGLGCAVTRTYVRTIPNLRSCCAWRESVPAP
jgi:hypothetical protein